MSQIRLSGQFARARLVLAASAAVLTLLLAATVRCDAAWATSTAVSSLPNEYAVLLSESSRLAKELGDELFPGFAQTPFPILLLTGEEEFLIGWPKDPPAGFGLGGYHPKLGSIFVRPKTFSPHLEASFPAFGPSEVVVIGTPEATGRSVVDWVLILIHEHFHQFQSADSEFYAEVDALGLAGGDDSGMWMLDYPFPYDDPEVGRQVTDLSSQLLEFLNQDEDATGATLRQALDRFVEGLDEKDGRYLSFQLWKEGIARYVELRMAQLAADRFEPSPEFVALAAEETFVRAAADLETRILGLLGKADLAGQGRSYFYPLGAAMGLLLDRADESWKIRYLAGRFELRFEELVPLKSE